MSAPIQKQPSDEQATLPLFSLLTFSPLANPLAEMTPVQRQFFFSSMMRLLQMQSAENESRVRALAPKMMPPISTIGMLIRKVKGKEKEKERNFAQSQAEIEAKPVAVPALPTFRLGKKKQAQMPAQGSDGETSQRISETGQKGQSLRADWGASSSPLTDSGLISRQERVVEMQKGDMLRRIVFKKDASRIKRVQEQLALTLNDYARGDAQKAEAVLAEFSRRLEAQEYRADELGAVLLLVIEDHAWAGEEGSVGSARPGGSASRVLAALPEKMKQSASQAAQMRLASVREMLRYYFLRNSGEYYKIVAIALGMSEAEAGDPDMVQEKLDAEIARAGGFAVGEKMLAAIKLKKKLDEKNCLLELGYKFDREKKILIVGKRTCWKPIEGRKMVSALMSKFRKPKGKKP